MKKTYLPGFAIPASRIARMFNRALKPQRIISTTGRPVNTTLLLLLAALPLAAQNTATTSGDFDKCATWGNPATIFQNVTDTKTINTGVTVNAVTTGWSTKEIVLNGTGAVDLSGTSYVSFDTDNGADKSCFVCGSNVTFTYGGSSVTYGTVASPTGRCWLDRNLGATQVATSETDAAAYGNLSQWGRLIDGHQLSTAGTTTTRSTTDVPGHGNFITPGGTLPWRNPVNLSLWQTVSGNNNVCPTGFRVPTEAEWDTETATWSSQNSAGAFASVLKLPKGGFRDASTGNVVAAGTLGYYWSSTVGSVSPYLVTVIRIEPNNKLKETVSQPRGNAVRCIKD